MERDRARAEVEWQRGRRAHVDPVHAALMPTMWTVVVVALLHAIGLGFIPFWGLLLASTAVFGSVWLFTRQINEAMQSEIEKLSARR